MNLQFPGHRAPAVGTEVPLEMLAACHLRMEQQCATLQRLVRHIGAHGCDAQARSAAAGVMRYFDTAARDHHDDEEADLFPALIESMAGSDAVCLRELTEALARDHRELERAWRELRAGLEQVAAGAAVELAGDEVDAFVNRYAAHIAREEAELLPMAKRLLGDDALERIGQAMRRRRGITLPDATDLENGAGPTLPTTRR
jgi:hemerythrin-like domain-containing protein